MHDRKEPKVGNITLNEQNDIEENSEKGKSSHFYVLNL